MAKNYTFAEVVNIINEGKDLESLVDIGRRYPVLLQKVTKVTTKAGQDFVELMSFMPEYLTANKVNTAIKALIAGEGNEDSGEDAGDDAGEATGTEGGKDYESMSAKQLWDILGKAGKRKLAKSTKKSDLVAACKAMDAGEEPAGDDEDEDAGEDSGNAYEGKSAMELFKECKKRGIKAAPKKPAKFYADLLTKDDAAKSEDADDAEEDGEDWDEEEAPKAKKDEKSAKKPAAKTEKAAKPAKAEKPAKASKKDDDDDEDWDI